MESYILTRSMHLGYLKETFGRGAVISFNPEINKMTIDGRSFDDHRDLEVLKNQACKKPHAPWIVQYSKEALQDIRGELHETAPAVPKRTPNGEGMEIVKSDEDMFETIDIRDTKVSARNQERVDAERQKVKDQGMPIIQGDQTVEERIAELKTAKDSDISARAARVRLMSERKADMPIIHDDSLGAGTGSASASMNAGMVTGGRRAEDSKETASAASTARKAEVKSNRQRVADEHGLDADQAGIDEVGAIPADCPIIEEVAETNKDAEIAALKAELATPAPQPVVDPRDAEIASLRLQLAEKRNSETPSPVKQVKQVKKMPLETKER